MEPPILKEVFNEALALPPGGGRSAYLERACRGDAALRARVEELLRDHDRVGHFLESSARTEGAGESQAGPPPEDEVGEALGFLAPSDEPDVLGRLGHYEILEVIGRGGMGLVLRALDARLHRVVAIKVMAPQLAAGPSARRRFTREARAAAAVSHDHVVTIHAVEEAGGLPYIVMQYVSGLSLQERLDRDGPLELREVVRIGMQAAAGLAAAHAQGLVHRDVKPANILLENGVERVKLTDFGLARAADDASLTQSGVVAGTPQYMAPEQARGEAVDHRADLFSLGSVLYAMCTGRAPFRAGGTMAVLKRVCEESSRPIREINPEVPEWLVSIIESLHAKDPTERPQSAVEVAELLARSLAHLQQPTQVPKPAAAASHPHKPRAVSRRHWAIAVALFALVGGLGLTEATGVTRLGTTVIRVLTPDGTLVVEVDDPEVKVSVEGDGGTVITGVGSGEVRLRPGLYRWTAIKGGKPLRTDLVTITRGGKEVVWVGLEPPSPARAIPPWRPPTPGPLDRLDPAAIPAAERFPWQPKELVAVLGEHRQRHWGIARSVAYSKDGRRVASGGSDNVIRVWDAETMRERAVLRGHTRDVWSVAFSADGRRILSGGWDATMRLWDAENGQQLRRPFQVQSQVHGVALSPDGRRALSAGTDRLVRLWDVETGEELGRLEGHSQSVASVAFSPDGRRALSGGLDNTLRLWDLEGREELRRLEGHTGKVSAVAFSPDGRHALSGNAHRHDAKANVDSPADGYELRLWDLDAGKELRRFAGHAGPVWSVAFTADGRRALSCSQDGTVRLWEVDTGEEARRFEGHVGVVLGVALSADGRRAVSGGADGTVRSWDVEAGREIRPITGPIGPAGRVAFAPDGGHLLAAGGDRIVRLWDVAGGEGACRFEGHTDPVASVALSADGRLALSASYVNEFYMPPPRDGDRAGPWRLWDVSTGEEVRRLAGPSTSWVASAALSPDGRRALTGSRSRVLLWGVETGRQLRALEGHGRTVLAVALSPDGRRALSAAEDVCLWDLESGQLLRRFRGHTLDITDVAFSPDGRHAASCGIDGTVRLWDLDGVESRSRVFLKWHEGQVSSVAFGPDDRTLASVGADGRIILWDVAAGDRLREWQLPGPVRGVAFAPDGRHLAAANGNATVYILRLTAGGP